MSKPRDVLQPDDRDAVVVAGAGELRRSWRCPPVEDARRAAARLVLRVVDQALPVVGRSPRRARRRGRRRRSSRGRRRAGPPRRGSWSTSRARTSVAVVGLRWSTGNKPVSSARRIARLAPARRRGGSTQRAELGSRCTSRRGSRRSALSSSGTRTSAQPRRCTWTSGPPMSSEVICWLLAPLISAAPAMTM